MFYDPDQLSTAILQALNQSSFNTSPNSPTLFDRYGAPTNSTAAAWGCSFETCVQYSNELNGWTFISWERFAPQVSTWLIPWLALLAQLPFETRNTTTDLMSLLLMLGSPMLAVYSLCLAVLNASWIQDVFTREQKRWQQGSLRRAPGDRMKAIRATREILIETQHIPIQIVKGRYNDFAQSIVRPENTEWWCNLLKEILKTKREKTASLHMQLAWVLVTYLLSIIQFFTTGADNNSIVLGLAVAALYVWMLPVVWGYVFVGTQNFASSINNTLENFHAPVIKDPAGSNQSTWDVIKDRTNDVVVPANDCIYGFQIAGWEQEPGPLFAYARVWSHLTACHHVLQSWHYLAQKQSERLAVDTAVLWNDNDLAANLVGNPDQIGEYICQDLSSIKGEMSVHSNTPQIATRNIIIATLVALAMQWSSTGSAILIAYNTPPVGLGCDSGAYLFYGTAATLTWSLLVTSAWLSHFWAKQKESLGPRRPAAFSAASLAVITRVAGNALGICNAFWVLVFSVLQFTNLYNNCWCASSAMQWGPKSWVLLFASPADIFAFSQTYWAAGTFLGLVIAFFCTVSLMVVLAKK